MVAEGIQNIRQNIDKTCLRVGRDPKTVLLLAVSKSLPAEPIRKAFNAGIRDFGENYVQELLKKKEELKEQEIRWHMIGHLQSNKVKYISEWITMIHSVDNEGLAEEIQKRCKKANRTIDILMEVNTSEEATKFGVKPEKAIALLQTISRFPNINLKGLMTIGPFTENIDESRQSFRLLKSIFDSANNEGFLRESLSVLSMGMTHDYTIAIEEGSTMVRIGTAIFGSRTKQ